MIPTNDKWFRIGIVFLLICVAFVTNGLLESPVTAEKLARGFVSSVAIILICEGVRYIIYNSRSSRFKKYAGRRQLMVVITGIVYTMIILAASKVLRLYLSTGTWDAASTLSANVTVNGREITFGLFTYALFNAIVNFFLLYILYEILYHYAKLRFTELQKETLEKEKLKAELQQLKGIVNPHFLFNNLNSLSALITENPAQAELFLDELTKVFRYLLRNNTTDLTTVASELEFIDSYYKLLQTRHGNSINMNIQVDPSYHEMALPPLTLQLLLENAVKHNSMEKDNPLQITLCSAPGKKLVMRNNISRRVMPVESTGIGLQNINARYRMLQRDGVEIKRTETDFSVVIPLVEM